MSTANRNNMIAAVDVPSSAAPVVMFPAGEVQTRAAYTRIELVW